MREIIFIGTTDFVSQQRKECMCKVIDLVNDLNLCGHVEVANDPFFCDGAEDKRTFQRGFELKYELRLSLPYEKKTLAVASFNIHDDFFAKTFNIRGKKGQEINTGCVAFGLERWVYAFLSQYGLSMDQWPKPVADFCRH